MSVIGLLLSTFSGKGYEFRRRSLMESKLPKCFGCGVFFLSNLIIIIVVVVW
jgi:hypothetical protein